MNVVFLAVSGLSRFPFGVGPAWASSLPLVREFVSGLSSSPKRGATALTDFPPLQDLFQTMGIPVHRVGRGRLSLLKIAGMLESQGVNESAWVNPFCVNLGIADLRLAMKLFEEGSRPVVSLAPPRTHPVLLGGGDWRPVRRGKTRRRIIRGWVRSNLWVRTGGSLYVKRPGIRLVERESAGKAGRMGVRINAVEKNFQRQNFPGVWELCNAFLVSDRRGIEHLDRRLESGDFTPVKLDRAKALDVSRPLDWWEAGRRVPAG